MRILVGSSDPDHYAVLGLTPSASSTDVTRAYRALMRHLHPDTRARLYRSGSTAELRFDGATTLGGVVARFPSASHARLPPTR